MSFPVHVNVTNAEWAEGCDDTEDHEHPDEFDAIVYIDGYDSMDEDERISEIHLALMEQCDCCVIECDIDILEDYRSHSTVSTRRSTNRNVS